MAALVAIAVPPIALAAYDPPRASSGPLGYANADVLLLVLAGFGVLVVGTRAERPPPGAARGFVPVAAVACFAAALLGRSTGGALALAVGLAVTLLGRWRQRAAAVAIVTVALVALATTVALARPDDIADGRSLHARQALWGDAVSLLLDHPGGGVGLGGFDENRTSTHDDDLRYAHSLPLQMAAEMGVGGLVLYLVGVGALARTVARARPGWPMALGSGAAAAAVVHGSVDWVLQDPRVLGLALLVVGLGSGVVRLEQLHPRRWAGEARR